MRLFTVTKEKLYTLSERTKLSFLCLLLLLMLGTMAFTAVTSKTPLYANAPAQHETCCTNAREDKVLNPFLIGALQHYGYPALWLIVFVAAAGAPISGSLLLFAAGAFAALGDLNMVILFPVALSAAVMGDNLGYFIGRRVGTQIGRASCR